MSPIVHAQISWMLKRARACSGGPIHCETVTYEGFAPHQVPVIVECLTDSVNRTASRRLSFALIAEPADPAVDAERILYRQAYAHILEALIAEAVAKGECPPTDPAVTAAFLVGGLAEALVGPLAPDAQATEPAVLVETIVHAAERAVFGESP